MTAVEDGPVVPRDLHERTPRGQEVLRVEDLKTHFPIRGGITRRQVGTVYAVDGVSLHVAAGETLGLVGESGCGKSTTGRTLLKLQEPTAGRGGSRATTYRAEPARRCKACAGDMQIVFQDPYASLNPRMTVGSSSPSRCRSTACTATGTAGRASTSCSSRSGSTPSTPTATRTSSPAASGSASASPGRWRSTRSCSCSTSRCPRSTSRSRRRS